MGLDKKVAILEGSKAYSKDFMKKYGIKTAIMKFLIILGKLRNFLNNWKDFPVVIKGERTGSRKRSYNRSKSG